jgi:hypothetical protein
VVWEIRDAAPASSDRQFTYRALKTGVPDAIAPRVDVAAPAGGATYVEGDLTAPSYDCTDRGGSSLASCTASGFATTPGAHTVTVTATDGAGTATAVTRHYTVLAASSPAVLARSHGALEDGEVRTTVKRVGHRVRLTVVLRNDGARPDRLAWSAKGGGPFRLVGRTSGAAAALAPGASRTVTLKLLRPEGVADGRRGKVKVRVVSALTGRSATLTWRLRAR